MKKILFITATRLGDAVLSMGVLSALLDENPKASVTVVCGPIPASLFEGVPGLSQIIAVRKKPMNGHWFEILGAVMGTKWDVVVDLRNSIVGHCVWTARRCFVKPVPKVAVRHKVEENASAIGREGDPPAPRLWVTEEQKTMARALVPDGAPVLAVGPTANWLGKMWPAGNFMALIKQLIATDGLFPDARVAVFGAPGEEAVAQAVFDTIPASRRIDMIARCDPGTAAAALSRCQFYIGNDSGLMHCAAAAGIPTVGLFGPSYPDLYRPWGAQASFVSTPETYDQLIAYPGYDSKTVSSLMTTLSVDAVLAHITQRRSGHV